MLWHPFAGADQMIVGYGSIDGNNTSSICQYRSIHTGEQLRGCLDDPFPISVGFGGTAIENERVFVVGVDADHGDSGGAVFALDDVESPAELPLVGITAFAHGCAGVNSTECGAVAMRLTDIEQWVHSR